VTPEELREYVLAVHAPAARAESLREDGRADWYTGTCDSAVSTIIECLGEDVLHPIRPVWWGSFVLDDADDLELDGHCWFEDPTTGALIDPTSEQYGLEPCLVARYGEGDGARYLRGASAGIEDWPWAPSQLDVAARRS
jgi:hypothetical protein